MAIVMLSGQVHMSRIEEVEQVIKQKWTREGFKGKLHYDPAKVIENERWWSGSTVTRRNVAVADQRKLWTKYRLNDRLDRVEGRTQRAVEAVTLGHESR